MGRELVGGDAEGGGGGEECVEGGGRRGGREDREGRRDEEEGADLLVERRGALEHGDELCDGARGTQGSDRLWEG